MLQIETERTFSKRVEFYCTYIGWITGDKSQLLQLIFKLAQMFFFVPWKIWQMIKFAFKTFCVNIM